MKITVQNRQRKVRLDLPALKTLARHAALAVRPHKAKPATPLDGLEEVGVVILRDDAIAEVHARFFGDPEPTDVITFDHGEILIGAETAEANARRFRTTPDGEVGLYIIHGLLHLNGHTDSTRPGAERMRRIQGRIHAACKRAIAAALLFCLALPPLAAAQDAPPVDPAKMLEALEALRENYESSKARLLDEALREIAAAAATPSAATALYRKAMKIADDPAEGTREEAKKNRNLAASEIRRRENAELREPALQQAIQLHLRYLALTIERSRSDDPAKFIEPAFAHIKAADALPPEVAGQDILKADVAKGPFAAYYRLDVLLDVPEQWEGRPTATAAIGNKAILGPLREAKDPRLLAYWDYRIETGADRAAQPNGKDAAEWERRTRPALLWSRARDLLLLGQRNRALGEMFAICKNFTDHPDAPEWIDALQTLLSGGPAATP